MSNYFKTIFKIKSTYTLMYLSFFCLILSFCRVLITKNIFLLFLVWNLFLAFLPWFISSILYTVKECKKVIFIISAFIWLLFFPNSLYIVTDFIHLKTTASSTRWYDLILIFSYSFAGLFYGFVSLDFIETKINKLFNINCAKIISILVLYLSALGIYLGRFLRWNSWDIVTNLFSVLNDLFLPIKNPFTHIRTWVFVFLLGSLFNLLYASYKSFKKD